MNRILTGKELRVAIKYRRDVFYFEHHHDPRDAHKNFNGRCVLKKATVGYYIGNSDIDPDEWDDDEPVTGDFNEGWFAVYAFPFTKYSERC